MGPELDRVPARGHLFRIGFPRLQPVLTMRFHVRSMLLPGLLLTAVLVGGCSTQVIEERPSGELFAVAPSLSVERFLQAVTEQDYGAMSRLFGTVDGPIEGDRMEVEIRMATIAEILRHQDYEIITERRPPGREAPTRRIGVDLRVGNRVVRDVGFTVVQSESGGWLVEQIELEKVTAD